MEHYNNSYDKIKFYCNHFEYYKPRVHVNKFVEILIYCLIYQLCFVVDFNEKQLF